MFRSTPRDPKSYLSDMTVACGRVQALVGSTDWDGYCRTPSLRWAIERQLSILGEALYQLRASHPETAARIPDARDIINFRHVLIHGYAVVEDGTVWGVATTRVRPLQHAIQTLLNELE